jgi:hypothetical protein
VGHLDEEQLKELEAIMEKDLDDMTQFEMITAELKGMGIDDEDIADLKALGVLMNEFVSRANRICIWPQIRFVSSLTIRLCFS